MTESTFLEVNVQSSKWLFVSSYKPASENEEFFISNLCKTIDEFATKYDNILLIGDFNLTIENKHLEELLSLFNISSPTCFQSINPTCIDLLLTNQEDLFSTSNTREVGISDHHHLVSTMLKKKFLNGSTKTLFYRDYKKFEENKFARDVTHELQNIKNLSYKQFEKAFVTVLDNHLPLKKKQLRFNHSPFMTKALRKAIMTRSRLKNIYNKKRSYENWDKYKKTKKFLRETPSQNKTGLLHQY